MKKRNLFKCCLLVIMSFYLLSACTKKENNEKANIDLFNPKEAVKVAENYLNYVKDNNIEEANKLCTEQLISKNKEISTGTSRIIAYAPDNMIESSGSAYVIYNVIRNSASEPKCDLDNYAIKVLKIDDQYKIDEVKSMNKKQVFVRNKSLRMIGEDGGKSDLILTLNNLPKDVYLSENKIMLYKEKAPSEAFGPVSLGYKGQKVAISTIGNNKTFLSIAYIEESKATQGEANESNPNKEGSTEVNLEDALDKPIAKKVIPLDLLINIKIDNLVFTKEEGFLIVEYLNSNSVRRIKVYNGENGELVDIEFDKEFPVDTYNISLIKFDKEDFKISVGGKLGAKDINAEKLGEYDVSIEGKEIKKST